jgi:hypothetical protein
MKVNESQLMKANESELMKANESEWKWMKVIES